MRQSTNSRDFDLFWVDGTRLTDLDFADDVVLIDSDVKRLQELRTAVEQEASKVGLCVNSNKCRVMVSGGWEGSADIYASGAIIETVVDFCYLGSYISTTGNCDQEVNVRIGKAAGVFSKLCKLWNSKKISLPVKTRLYEALVLSTLLNSAELWPVSVTQMKNSKHHTKDGNEVSWGFPGRTKSWTLGCPRTSYNAS